MEQDWINGLIGGGIIGLAGAAYLLINGRIMGASGILGGLIDGTGHKFAIERASFIAGLILVPGLIALFTGAGNTHLTSNLGVVLAAGLLVGLGTRIANGCTSGHGVCGISRLSFRGITATIFYIFAGGLTVVVFRHLLGVI